MRRGKLILAAAAASALTSQFALAVDYSWQNFAGGTYTWNTAANWSPSGVPSLAGDSANISGAVTGSNLNIAITADVNVSTLTVGATGSPFTVNLGDGNSGGGALALENGASAVTVNSVGSAGSTNVISAPLFLGSTVGTGTSTQANVTNVGGTVPISFLGGLTAFMNNNGSGTPNLTRTLNLNVGSTTTGATYTFGAIQLAQVGATANGSLIISSAGLNATTTFVHGGTVVFNGAISNGGISGGRLTLGNNGSASSFTSVPTTYVFNVDNSYTGNSTLGRGDYVLNTATPFGASLLQQNANANTYGIRFYSDGDTRTLPNNVQIQQNLTFVGNNSLTLTGNMFQSNARDQTNLLPAGKTLTYNGFVAVTTGSDGASEGEGRRLQFDGSGLTVVNGPIYNHRKPWFGPGSFNDVNEEQFATGSLYKKGTGTLVLDPTVLPTISDGTNTFTGATSTYRGQTRVQGGLVEFANSMAYGKLDSYTGGSFSNYSSTGTVRVLVGPGGAVGVRTGTLAQDFVDRLTATFAGAPSLFGGNTGGLALSTVDAATNIDFSSGSLANSAVSGMSIGALSSGVTYTGTITPNASAGYRLGGGGTLTLPNANQLTGGNNVTVTNGGTVAITGSNNYTGTTTVRGDYIETAEVLARTSAGTNNIAGGYAVRVASTLSVNSLANGGTASSIGSSSSAASNLVLNGATLQYTGSGASTDRLFTVNPVGATLDSSGSGAVNFTNPGAIALTDAPNRTGNLANNSRVISNVGDVSDLTPGMTLTVDVGGVGTFIPGGTSLIGVNNTWSGALTGTGTITGNIAMSANATPAATGATLIFGNQNRNLNLTGSNAGANTLAAQLTDSAKGKLGIVKSGSGAWNVTGASNSYSGGVTVNAGTLTVKKLVGNGTTTINGGTLRISPGGSVGDTSATSVFVENGFGIAGGASPAGRLDIGKNGVVFDYTTTSPKATIAALITAGRAGGAWTGNGITSSDAAANATAHGVGYAEASAIGSPASFLGQTIDATAVVARYTRLGDANLTGNVDLDDFTSLAANFGLSGEWSSGDFDYSGSVNLDDFTILAANFGLSAAGDLPRGSAVPEPATLSLLAAGAMLLGRRRR